MKQFLYFLQTEDKRCYYINNGVVSLSARQRPLAFTPDGWLDIEIQRLRSSKYFAIERTFTAPLDFVGDGAQILKHLFYNRGVEEKVYLAIADLRLWHDGNAGYILDENGNPVLDEYGVPLETEEVGEFEFYYSLLYRGEVDFSQFKHIGPKVSATLIEGGPAKLIKANENTKYEIPIDGRYEYVLMDGIYLREKRNFITQSGQVVASHLPGIIPTTSEGKAPGIATLSVYQKSTPGGIDFTASEDYFMLASQAVTGISIQGDIKFNYLAAILGGGTVSIRTSKGRTIPIGSYSGSGLKDIPVNITFDALENEKFFLYVQDVSANLFDYQETNLSISFRSRHKETQAKALRPIELLKRICAKMGINKVKSNVLDEFSNLVVTCGDAIRGLENPVIKTSFSDFFTAYDIPLCLSLGVEGDTLVIERKENKIIYTDPISLGECKDLTISLDPDCTVNTIKIGYPDQQYDKDDPNGRYEFNGTQLYTTPITRLTKELTLVSPYRADSLGAEYLRINTEGKDTASASGDSDVWMLHIEKQRTGTYYRLDRTLNPYATGLLEPETVYNLWLSPKQCLLRQGPFVRSHFYGMDNEFLRYQSAEKDSDLVVSQPGYRTVVEKGDVEIGSLGNRLFTPVSLEFENKVPTDILELFKQNGLACFSFTNDGIEYVGLPVKSSVKPGNNQAQSFKLLSAPFNDLKPLIEYQ